MRLALPLAVALAFQVHAQVPAGQQESELNIRSEVRLKAAQLVEVSGVRDRFAIAIPDLIEQGMVAMRKQCPACNPAFVTEWGKRMTGRIKVDDFLNVAVRAYAKRFSDDEMTELLTVARSQKSQKPVPLSPALQKKVLDLMPALMGDITGGCTELGARLGGEVAAEIEKEHPEYKEYTPKGAQP